MDSKFSHPSSWSGALACKSKSLSPFQGLFENCVPQNPVVKHHVLHQMVVLCCFGVYHSIHMYTPLSDSHRSPILLVWDLGISRWYSIESLGITIAVEQLCNYVYDCICNYVIHIITYTHINYYIQLCDTFKPPISTGVLVVPGGTLILLKNRKAADGQDNFSESEREREREI